MTVSFELDATDKEKSLGKRAGDLSRAGKPGRAVPKPTLLQSADLAALRRASWFAIAADMIWIPQAALLASVLATCLLAATVGGAVDTTWLLAGVAGFAALALPRTALQYTSGRLAGDAARAVRARVRTQVLTRLAGTSPAADLPSSGSVAISLSEQVDALGPYISHFKPQAQRVRWVPLIIILTVLPMSWMAALILVIAGPVIPLFMALIGMRAKAVSAHQQEELARMGGLLLDRIRGLETLRLFGALGRTVGDVEQTGEAFRTKTMGVLKIAFLSSTVLELFSALGIAFVAVYVGFSLLGDITIGTWGGELSYFTGLFILLLAPEFFAPLRSYAAAYHDRAAGLAAEDKLQGLMEGLAEAPDGVVTHREQVRSVPPSGQAPAIIWSNVTLRLGRRTVLDGASLDIRPGETIILTGESGAGKTTVIDLCLGFHRPSAGRVWLGGQDLERLDPESWRASLAWLGQDPTLFHGSLRSNLALANPDASAQDLLAALAVAGASDLVERLPKGLDTRLGDNGFGLSVGEIRRVALARAALRKDARLLLADEPTAALDRQTAQDVMTGLDRLRQGRTTIIATHDPNLIALGDRHLVLSGGQLT
ncbi:thiol reductant ABC exporter subunit CydD [Roseibium aquae]|uniref:Thiol reductant ABC exporter subunit CydD n=1 Tax=Roseibium aquae TaxID=1323746 RepID=A0A916TFC8_9HYPH|nr:thiol reductant ABC exporter subunit CydD [Roseibium aquae]GGB41555.1 thiol reductant ABC exporter subunit CydD [Roseibium aquae]